MSDYLPTAYGVPGSSPRGLVMALRPPIVVDDASKGLDFNDR